MTSKTNRNKGASGPTNPTPNSVVTSTGRPGIQITYRFFAATTTAKLTGKPDPGDSMSLRSVPIVIGTVEAGVFKPLHPGVAGISGATDVLGRLNSGVLEVLSPAEVKSLKALQNTSKDAKQSAEARQQAKDELQRSFAGVQAVSMHVDRAPVRVGAGVTVGVCLGIDAKSLHRKHPLWQVTAGDNDIVVDVFETYGPIALDDKVSKPRTVDLGTKEAPCPTDFYAAALSGALWLRSTHPFTPTDVDALPKEAASDEARKALRRIFEGTFEAMSGGDFGLDVASHPEGDAQRKVVRLHWIAAENGNCTRNIANLNVQKEVPRRIHPAAYAAVALAAQKAGIDRVSFTNSWRPMLGSWPHRSGLGLDIKWLVKDNEALKLNRKDLMDRKLTDKDKNGVVDGTNIAVEEQQAFNDWKASEGAAAAAADAEKAAKKASDAASDALKVARNKGNADAIEVAEHVAAEAKKGLDAAVRARAAAEGADRSARATWEKQLKGNEPSSVGSYRRYVMQQPCVSQVIDPWYVTLNTTKPEEAIPNDQNKATLNGLLVQHNNHMHLTIRDPELKP